jgi:predicted small integral membrane protein
MEQLTWMAWTWQTAVFWAAIAALLAGMTLLAAFRPELERYGVLRIPTTRGDRLFVSLVGSAFIHLAWLGLAGPEVLWGAAIASLVTTAAVFRWV